MATAITQPDYTPANGRGVGACAGYLRAGTRSVLRIVYPACHAGCEKLMHPEIESTAALLPQHAALIEASSIASEVAIARGYRSIIRAADAAALGFNTAQAACVPALLVPVHSVGDGIVTYQMRPDHPRERDGKPLKYETPAGSRMALDVPPAARAALGNPHVPLYVTEGARKADAAVSRGACCIALLGVWNWRGTNEHGGKTALAEWENIALNGRTVTIAFDSDVMTKPAVRGALDRLTAFLQSRGARVRWAHLPTTPDGGKVGLDDYLAAGHTMDEVDALAADAPTNASTDADATENAEVAWTPPVRERPAPLIREAFHGLAGDFVHTVAPHTESDEAALLMQFLVATGNLIGRGPYVPVEADRHGTNLFAAFVGDSAKARKGTSWGHVRRVCERVDSEWAGSRIADGLGSGEALIEEVRDPPSDTSDSGTTDKRLLLMVPEFAGLLKAQGREGSTLSPVLRNAWDGGTLRVMTRKNPVKATGAHISVIAHITRPELLRVFSETEGTNGYANRFLWVAVARSKELPFGGDLAPDALNPIVTGLHGALNAARCVEAVRWSDAARAIWEGVYSDLSASQPGMFGAVTARAEAQVLRLALLYALLDMSAVITPEHLYAALAVWRYCEDSARWVFGDRLGDATADTILTALRGAGATGLTRTEIADLFGRHASAGRLATALGALADAGLASCAREATGGRPTERWYATAQKAQKAGKASVSETGEDFLRANSLFSPPQGDGGVEAGPQRAHGEGEKSRTPDVPVNWNGTPDSTTTRYTTTQIRTWLDYAAEQETLSVIPAGVRLFASARNIHQRRDESPPQFVVRLRAALWSGAT